MKCSGRVWMLWNNRNKPRSNDTGRQYHGINSRAFSRPFSARALVFSRVVSRLAFILAPLLLLSTLAHKRPRLLHVRQIVQRHGGKLSLNLLRLPGLMPHCLRLFGRLGEALISHPLLAGFHLGQPALAALDIQLLALMAAG